MNFVALKMLLGDKLKYLGLVAGLSFAALLITQQASIFAGMIHQTGAFIRDTGSGDLWVMDPQMEFSEDQKPLPDTALARVRGVEGVEWAVPLYKGWLKCRLPDGTRTTAILIGIDDATLIGGPPEMVHGTLEDLRRDAAVIVNEHDRKTKLVMKRDLKPGEAPREIQIGDRIAINDQDAIVVGSAKASPSFFWDPLFYTTYSRALKFAPRERKLMNFVMVKCKPGIDVAEVAARITDATGYVARTNAEFQRVTAGYIMDKTGILINFGIAVGLGFVVGVLISAQTLYNFTLDNLKFFGALKAMGTSNLTLIRMVILQTLTVGGVGYGIGVGITSLMGHALKSTDLAFKMPWQIPAIGAGALLVICVISALLSIARVMRLEPAIVFKN